MSGRKLEFAMVVFLCLLPLAFIAIKFGSGLSESPQQSCPQTPSLEDEIDLRMKGPLTAESSSLIQKIRDKYLLPPSNEPYNFTRKKNERNLYMSGFLINSVTNDLFKGKRNGFFVEAGALDGEYMSHTLKLEQKRGWRGLLVEPDLQNFEQLKAKHRKAWLSPTCLATHGYPETVLLKRVTEPRFGVNALNRGTAQIVEETALDAPGTLFNALLTFGQCVPLQSLLLALNVSHVDFFVLDVEQVERKILENFPFDKISVDVWAIEHVGFSEDREFITFMISKGYYYFDMLCYRVADYIFVRRKSHIFSLFKVPKAVETRTDICRYKKYNGNRNATLLLAELRDPHHYPELSYKDVPERTNQSHPLLNKHNIVW